MKDFAVTEQDARQTTAQCRDCKWFVCVQFGPDEAWEEFMSAETCLCEPHFHTLGQVFDGGNRIMGIDMLTMPYTLYLRNPARVGATLTIGKPGAPFKSFVVTRTADEPLRGSESIRNGCQLRETTQLYTKPQEVQP